MLCQMISLSRQEVCTVGGDPYIHKLAYHKAYLPGYLQTRNTLKAYVAELQSH